MIAARRERLGILLLLVLATTLGACASRRGGAPRPWEAYANAGPLRVYGAPRDAPGPRVYRALAGRSELRGVFDDGEPDALEVVHGRRDATRIVIAYWRPGAGRPRRVVLDSVGGRFVASAPQPAARARRTAARRGRPDIADAAVPAVATDSDDRGGRAPAPTAAQVLECPIDRRRADCHAYCVAGAAYEWCR